jgi:hypothetical protein
MKQRVAPLRSFATSDSTRTLRAHLPPCLSFIFACSRGTVACLHPQKFGKDFDELEGRERQSVGGTVGGQHRKQQMEEVSLLVCCMAACWLPFFYSVTKQASAVGLH